MVYRVYVEKKAGQTHEADSLLKEVQEFLQISGLSSVRVLNFHYTSILPYKDSQVFQAFSKGTNCPKKIQPDLLYHIQKPMSIEKQAFLPMFCKFFSKFYATGVKILPEAGGFWIVSRLWGAENPLHLCKLAF